MDHLEFFDEPPSQMSTLVVAFSGWTDAGEASSGALRYMTRRLPARKLASIDPEEFYDFTQIRPRARLMPDGTRTIRWPTNDFYMWRRSEDDGGILLFRGTEPSLKWRTYIKVILDLAERCGVERIVGLGALLASIPHTRPPRVTGTTTDQRWQEVLEEWGILRRPTYQGPTGITSVLYEQASLRGIPYLSFMGQSPHYIQASPNPMVSKALVTYVCRLLGLSMDMHRLDKAAAEFRVRCDQLVSQETTVRTYVKQLEEEYDKAANPDVGLDEDDGAHALDATDIVQELEEFLRKQQEKDSGS